MPLPGRARARPSADEARHRDLVVRRCGFGIGLRQGEGCRRVGTSRAQCGPSPGRRCPQRDGLRCPGRRMRTAWWSKRWRSRGRSLLPVKSSCVWRMPDAREAVIELPETLRPAIGSTGRATLYGSGLTGSAKLRQLSDAANRQTRTFEARYVLDGSVWPTRRWVRPSPSSSRTASATRRCRCRLARSSIRARVRAYGWLKGKRLESRGVPCKLPALATKRLRSSATSRWAIPWLRSVRIYCTKASRCDCAARRRQAVAAKGGAAS